MSKEFHQHDWDPATEEDLRQLIRLAVREDLERQVDWTTVALVDPDQLGSAVVVARQPGIVAGLRAVPTLIDEMQADIAWQARVLDGAQVAQSEIVADLSGSARDLLTCERVLLNLLGRLSGIATLTHQYAQQIVDTRARIYDTRKTTPGWRRLEKYAVRCGGGMNHRTGLYDAILIKDNHIALASGDHVTPAMAVARARDFIRKIVPGSIPGLDAEQYIVEVEIDALSQLDDVLLAAPDIILLDNMRPDLLRKAVSRRDELAPAVELESSGGVTLLTVRELAETGVDRISVGALTHSAPSLDLALDWLPPESR